MHARAAAASRPRFCYGEISCVCVCVCFVLLHCGLQLSLSPFSCHSPPVGSHACCVAQRGCSTLATSGTHQHEQHAKGFFSGVAEEACAPVHFQGLSVRPHLFCTSVCEQQDLVYNVVVKLKKQEAFAFAGRSCMCRLLGFLFMGCPFGSCSGPCHEFPGRNARNFTLFEPEPNMKPFLER